MQPREGGTAGMDSNMLPGSRECVGCHGLTFRNRSDGLCPRCAFQAESLIEQIELDSLERDLALITEFEAYCRQRDAADRPATPLSRTSLSEHRSGSPWADIPRSA